MGNKINVLENAQYKWAVSKKYKMTKMKEMTRNPFHCTATLKPAPHLEPIDYNSWPQCNPNTN
jgi:hypothetical protein